MSKYEPLRHFLEGQELQQIRVSFSDVERILGFKLPASKNHRAWWSNNPSNNVMTKAWLAAGYETEQVDIEGRRLVFRRVAKRSRSGTPLRGAPTSNGVPADEDKAHPLVGWMKGLTTIAPGVDLTDPSHAEWGKDW
jgi:hypothetical protein